MITSTGHSSLVTLELIVGGARFKLMQAADSFAKLAVPIELPASDAEILMHVDGKPTRMPVFLPEGCSLGNPRFPIAPPRTAT